jgi:hypothetical protein
VGSEMPLYSERCIAQKLLAGGFHGNLAAASMGIHGFPRASMPQQQPVVAFLERTRWFQTGRVDTSYLYELQEAFQLLWRVYNSSFCIVDAGRFFFRLAGQVNDVRQREVAFSLLPCVPAGYVRPILGALAGLVSAYCRYRYGHRLLRGRHREFISFFDSTDSSIAA